MPDQYYSQRENGLPRRTNNKIPETLWRSLQTKIRTEIELGNFGSEFSEECPDGQARIASSDGHSFWQRVLTEIPAFSDTNTLTSGKAEQPSTFAILDLLEFCGLHINTSFKGNSHSYFDHFHLSWNEEGKEQALIDFATLINRWLATNGICFQLSNQGKIERILSEEQEQAISSPAFSSDRDLNNYINDAQQEFQKPNRDISLANKHLWDAFERIKTHEDLKGKDKREKVTNLIENLSKGEPILIDAFTAQFETLTKIGNSFSIRHSETTQNENLDENYATYFFVSTLSLIKLIINELSL